MKLPLLKYLRKYVIFTTLWLVLGLALVAPSMYETMRFLRAKSIDDLQQVQTTLKKHPYVLMRAQALTYTNIDIVFESKSRKVTYHGYELKLNNEKMLLFRKANARDSKTLILKESTFSEANNLQFQETIFAQYMLESNLSKPEAIAMFVDGVYIDMMGEIKSWMPWFLLSIVHVLLALAFFGVAMWHYAQAKHNKGPYQILANKTFEPVHHKLWMSKKEFVVFNKGVKVLPFDTIMNVMQKEDELFIYFPKYALQIKAKSATIKHLYRHLYPEILIS